MERLYQFDQPIDEDSLDQESLKELRDQLGNLQGNILRGHSRDHCVCIFLRFKNGQKTEVMKRIKKLPITSAQRQREDAARHRQYNIPGRVFMSFGLSAAGYEYLGYKLTKDTGDEPVFDREAFRYGAKAAQSSLQDPDVKQWDEGYQKDIHAMIMLADNDERVLLQRAGALLNLFETCAEVCTIEHGHMLRNSQGDTVEHFGFVDGRSQPLFFQRDIERNREKGGVYAWEPAGPSLVLVADPYGIRSFKITEQSLDNLRKDDGFPDGLLNEILEQLKALQDQEFNTEGKFWEAVEKIGNEQTVHDIKKRILKHADANSYSGSYLVFRKLAQNVRDFQEKQQKFAEALVKASGTPRDVTEADRKQAGALVMGRFADGTPIVLSATADRSSTAAPPPPVPNDFTYENDPEGLKCPFQAHIRKVNPRTESEKDIRIVRRGIPYGKRESLEELPTEDVGILFICYQNNIGSKFERLQKRWANAPNHPKKQTGIDPIIGQGGEENAGQQTWPVKWNDRSLTPFDFYGSVTLKGGEYFFVPSIYFLKNIDTFHFPLLAYSTWETPESAGTQSAVY